MISISKTDKTKENDHADIRITRKLVLFVLVSILITRIVFYMIYVLTFADFSFAGFLEHINIWDTDWYKSIITDGYPASATSTSSWAFFPLYPLTVGVVSFVTTLSLDLSGFIVSNVCFFIACLYSYKYIVKTRGDEEEAYFYIALMTFGICGFYDTLLYTEAMYLMFLTMCFYFLKDQQYIKMGICGALMSATRNTGVFFVFVVILDQAHAWRMKQKKTGEPFGFWKFIQHSFNQEKLVFGTMLIPSGMFSFMYYLYRRTGDGFAFMHIQKAFMQDTRSGIVNVWTRALRLYEGQLWVYAYLTALLLVLALILINRRGDETFWGVLNWFIPQQRGLGSMQRYFHTCVVVELTFSDYCMKLRRWMRIVILVILFFAECVLMSEWMNGNGLLV